MSSEEEMIAFVSARLDEDERTADALSFACRLPDKVPDFTACGGPAAEAYWERFEPLRAIRQVAAMRKLVTVALEHAATVDGEWGDCHEAAEIAAGQCPDHGAKAARRGLAPLVSIWSDHPDYRQEWTP